MDMQRRTYAVLAMAANLFDTVDKALHADVADVANSLVGGISWSAITGKPSTFPPSLHGLADNAVHSSAATSGKMLKANANGLPVDATNTDAQVSAAVTASHARQHALNATADHTMTATANNIFTADANGLPKDSGVSVTKINNGYDYSPMWAFFLGGAA